jgi:DNA-binding NarL/FixJ family response regulator
MNPSPSGMVARKSRVFIVDDHPLVREGLANLINGQDDLIVCGEAKDSAQAIDGIVKARPAGEIF